MNFIIGSSSSNKYIFLSIYNVPGTKSALDAAKMSKSFCWCGISGAVKVHKNSAMEYSGMHNLAWVWGNYFPNEKTGIQIVEVTRGRAACNPCCQLFTQCCLHQPMRFQRMGSTYRNSLFTSLKDPRHDLCLNHCVSPMSSSRRPTNVSFCSDIGRK